jgi:ABC-2 type transport system permease protein
MLPAINLRRTFLIARRDYLGYVKTWGFWISFFLPFIGGALGYTFTQLDLEFSPPRYEAILDETGEHKAGIVALHEGRKKRQVELMIEGLGAALLSDEDEAELKETLERDGIDAARKKIDILAPEIARQLKNLDSKLIIIDSPGEIFEQIQPFLAGEKTIEFKGNQISLDGLLYIANEEDGTKVDYWSKNINAYEMSSLAADYFEQRAEENYLSQGNLSRVGLNEARERTLTINSYDPTKRVAAGEAPQTIGTADKIPYWTAGAMAFFLWLTVFSGAYMLLTSMLEEKLNKLLEMMLASTRFSEIIFGKLLGVAALTLTAMAPYLIIGVLGLIVVLFNDKVPPEIAQALTQSFTPKLLIFFFVFLVLGYVFYGACFIAMGALSQSMQDAQTITTPIVIVLTLCVLVVPLGLSNPDSPLLRLASIFPLSAPFATISRLPSDPPLWELILSAVLLAVVSLGVIWAAGRVFRYGVLSGSGAEAITGWFKRVVLRRKA